MSKHDVIAEESTRSFFFGNLFSGKFMILWNKIEISFTLTWGCLLCGSYSGLFSCSSSWCSAPVELSSPFKCGTRGWAASITINSEEIRQIVKIRICIAKIADQKWKMEKWFRNRFQDRWIRATDKYGMKLWKRKTVEKYNERQYAFGNSKLRKDEPK